MFKDIISTLELKESMKVRESESEIIMRPSLACVVHPPRGLYLSVSKTGNLWVASEPFKASTVSEGSHCRALASFRKPEDHLETIFDLCGSSSQGTLTVRL